MTVKEESEELVRKLGKALRSAVDIYQYASMTKYERDICRDDMKEVEAILAAYEANQKS